MDSNKDVVQIVLSPAESSAGESNVLVKSLKQGSQAVELFSRTASSLSSNSVSWVVPVNERTLLSRKLLFQVPVCFIVPTQAAATRHFPLCPQNDQLNRLVSSCRVVCNGLSLVSQPELISRTVQAYDRSGDLLHHSSLGMAPNSPDYAFANDIPANDGATTVVGATVHPDSLTRSDVYHFKSLGAHDPDYPSRSTCKMVKTGVTDATGGGAGAMVVIQYDLVYSIKHPLFSSDATSYLANVKSLEITFDFDSSNVLQKGFFHPLLVQGSNVAITNQTAYIGVSSSAGVVSLPADRFKCIGYNITPSNPDMIPVSQRIGTNSFNFNEYPVGAIASGAESSITHSNINITTVPSHVFISCVPVLADIKSTRTDYHCKISNLNIVINNQSFSLNQQTQETLYEMCCNNGLMIPFSSFDQADYNTPMDVSTSYKHKGVGAPLCFRPGKDLGKSLVEGLSTGNLNLEIKYTATNLSGVAMSFNSRICLVSPMVITLTQGMSADHKIGVSQEEYIQALQDSQLIPSVDLEGDGTQDIVGGGFMSFLSQNKKGVNRFLHAVNPMLTQLSRANPELMPLSMASNVAQALTGGSKLAGGVLGGGDARRDELRRLGVFAR